MYKTHGHEAIKREELVNEIEKYTEALKGYAELLKERDMTDEEIENFNANRFMFSDMCFFYWTHIEAEKAKKNSEEASIPHHVRYCEEYEHTAGAPYIEATKEEYRAQRMKDWK